MGRDNPINLLKGFAAAKCLTALNLTIARIKVTGNQRNLAARKRRGEIALLFRSGQAAHVYDTKIAVLIREENKVAAYTLIDHYCHSIVSKFAIIETQRHCPPDLKEAIASLIYAAPRCTDLPELVEVKEMLTTKYGKDFAAAANEIKPECGVSRDIIELLSMHPPSGQIRVKLMKDICLQNNLNWRSEWAPGASKTTPPTIQDRKRNEMDEVSMHVQKAPSSTRPLDVPTQGSFPSDTRTKPGYDPKQGSFMTDEITRSNPRVSDMHHPQPYGPRFGSPLEDEATRANMKGGANEPSKPGIIPMHRKGAARDDEKVSEGMEKIYKPRLNPKCSSLVKEEHEHGKPIAASFGRHKVVDFKKATHEDRADYVMQHQDEISDSGSDLFDDDVAVSHKEGALRTSFQGTKEDNSSYANLRGLSSKETGLEREGYHRGNSQRGNKENSLDTNQSPYQKLTTPNQDQTQYIDRSIWDEEQLLKANQGRGKPANSNRGEKRHDLSSDPNIANDAPWVEKVIQESAALSPHLYDPLTEDEFASTARMIAAEAARLAVLNYAKQYSISRSSPKDNGDLPLENIEDDLSRSKPKGSDLDDDANGDPKKSGIDYNPYKPSNATHNESANASAKLFGANTSKGKGNAERPSLSRVHARAGSICADTFMRPVFNAEQAFTDERPHRRTHSEVVSDPEKQHEFSSSIKVGRLFPLERDPYFDGLTREELARSNQMSQDKSKSHRSNRFPHNEHHDNKWATSTGDASHDKMESTRVPQSINQNDDKCQKISGGIKSHAVHSKHSEVPNGPHRGKGHEDYIERGNLEPSSLHRGAPNQGEVHSQRTLTSVANVKENDYEEGKRAGRTHQEHGALQEDYLFKRKIDEDRRPLTKAVDAQVPDSRSGNGNQRHSEKSVVGEVVGARWHRQEASGKATLQDKEEGSRGLERTQNRPQESATRSKLLTKDSHQDKRNSVQHVEDPDFSMYKLHGQVEDVLKRPMSVQKRPQGRPEEVQATASNYNPHVQKREIHQEEYMPPSKQHNHERPQQTKHQGKQDTWPSGKERQSLHPFAVAPHEQDASGISPNCPPKPLPKHNVQERGTAVTSGRHKQDEPAKPLTRPQRNHPKEAEWNQQHSVYGNQKRQEQEVAAYKHDKAEKLDRTATPPTRPPPPVSRREQSEMESTPHARRSPERAKWKESPSSTPASFDHEPPSAKSQSYVPASLPTKLAASKMGDASKTPRKLPSVDDIAANLEALRQARHKAQIQ